jgi:hypothetical protein
MWSVSDTKDPATSAHVWFFCATPKAMPIAHVCKRVVQPRVIRPAHQQQILFRVIQAVAIDVVNYGPRQDAAVMVALVSQDVLSDIAGILVSSPMMPGLLKPIGVLGCNAAFPSRALFSGHVTMTFFEPKRLVRLVIEADYFLSASTFACAFRESCFTVFPVWVISTFEVMVMYEANRHFSLLVVQTRSNFSTATTLAKSFMFRCCLFHYKISHFEQAQGELNPLLPAFCSLFFYKICRTWRVQMEKKSRTELAAHGCYRSILSKRKNSSLFKYV